MRELPSTDPRVAAAARPGPPAGARALARGVLVIRWAVLVWMLALALFGVVQGRDPAVAVTAVAVTAAWVAWLTVARPAWTTAVLLADLLVAAALVVAGARYAWLATIYPVTAALSWGAARGLPGGLAAGGVLGAVSVVAGLAAAGDDVATLQVLRDPVYFLLAGGGVGFVATLLERSAAQVRRAQAEQVRATERAARLTERDSLGRQIHDSVLQALALVHKRGRELAAQREVEADEVARLAELAGEQERTLRALIQRRPADAPPAGRAALGARLQDAARTVDGHLPIEVTVVGDISLPATRVDEIGAAVDQALHNVVRHARASRAWVFAEMDGADVVVSVRDDGRGFAFDEAALRAAGKYGLLGSIGGRVEDLGGQLHIDSAPGRGTELELRVPAETSTAAGGEDATRG